MALGEWLPDQPALDNPGLTVARNVVARTSSSYGPWNQPITQSTNGLDARALGAVAGSDNQNSPLIFAGDASKLYRFQGGAFADVSRAGGYAVLAPYLESTSRVWRFEDFGSLMIATNASDKIQVFDMDTAAQFSDLAPTTAPTGRYLAEVGDFLFVGYTDDSFDGEQALRVWWSPVGNPSDDDWGNTNKQSDFQTLPSGRRITGIVGGEFGRIFCENAIYRATYAGPPRIFSFDREQIDHGCISPGSLAASRDSIFYLSNDGFQMLRGLTPVPIGQNRFDEFITKDLDAGHIDRIVSEMFDELNLYAMAYPGAGNNGGRPNRILLYNYLLDRATIVEQEVEIITSLRSTPLTVEQLGAIYTYTDDVPGLTDNPAYSGGKDFIGCFDPLHFLCSFDGPPAEATLQTGEFQGSNDNLSVVRKIRPLTDAPSVSMQLGRRNLQDSSVEWSPSVTPNTRTGLCTFKKRARYTRASISIPENVVWTETHGLDGFFAPNRGKQ